MNKTPATQHRWMRTMFATVLIANGLSYLWLFSGASFDFRIWGFHFAAVWIVPALIPVISLLTLYRQTLLSELKRIGSLVQWLAAIILTCCIVASMFVALSVMNASALDPSRAWNALAFSTLVDLPITTLWLSFCVGAYVVTWIVYPGIVLRESRHAHSIAMAAMPIAGLAVPFLVVFQQTSELFVSAFILLILSIHHFIGKLWRSCSLYATLFAFTTLASAILLVAGCKNELLNRLFFGSDVPAIAGLLDPRTPESSIVFFISSAVALLASLLLRRRHSTTNDTLASEQ